MSKDKRQVIKFQEREFNQQKVKYQKYIDAKDETINFIETETGVKLTTKEIEDGRTFETLKRKIALLHEDGNTLRLKPVKLMELLDMDVSGIIKRIDLLKMMPVKKAPTIEQYSIYAENAEQVNRLKKVNNLIEALTALNLTRPIDMRNPSCISFNGSQMEATPRFIKNGI